jgi:predicted dienelactone hydrolase
VRRLAVAALVVGCAPTEKAEDTSTAVIEAPWAPPDERGPFEVGATSIEWTDARGKEMVAEVWYPALPEAGAEPAPYPPLGLAGSAIREAPADLRFGSRPLVAFSHGYGGIRFQSIFLTEHLASHGFVVVSPDHTHNTFLDLDGEFTAQVVLERPDDVRFSVDELLARTADEDDRLHGLVDNEEYAIVGHSFGGYTAMVVGGGQVDMNGMVAYCASPGRGTGCDALEDVDPAELVNHGTSDDRAVVTVPMAPGVWYAFGADGQTAPGLAHVRAPLVLGGDVDNVLDFSDEIRPCFDAMAAPKTMVEFHGAGHYAFSDICELAPFLYPECEGSDGGWMDMARAHELTNVIVLAHIGHALLGDARYQDYLAPIHGAGEADITVETE